MGRIMAVVFPTILLFGAASASADQVSVSLHVEGWGRSLQGEDHRLVCVVTPPLAAHAGSDFSWYRNGNLLDSQKGRVLTFAPLSKRDEGNYQCGFKQDDGASWVQLSGPSFLRVIVLENICLVPEVEVEEGQTVTLNCSVHSDPTAFLTWRLGGKTLYTVRSNTDSLVLHNASQYHLRIVQCEAYNNELVLSFLDAYSVIRIKGTYEVVPTPYLSWKGDTVLHHHFALECIVRELPNRGVNVHLTYTWYKDDKVMEGQSDMILDFPSLRKEDSGLYTCTARNGKPRTTSLHSNAWEMVVLIPPVVHIEPRSPVNVITQAAGETLTLTCKVTEAFPGVAPEGYRWSYLPSPGGQLRPLEGRESTLTLGPLTREDSGQYICQAWNYEDFDGLLPPGNTSVTVDVVFPPVVHIEPRPPDNVITQAAGETLTLTCKVTEAFSGVVPDGYRWSYLPSPGGQLRPLEGRDSTLTLGPLTREDSGQYICQAWNYKDIDGLLPPGNASIIVDVLSMDIPRPPYLVSTPANKDMRTIGSSPSLTVDLGIVILNIILVVAVTGNLL